MTKVVSRLTAPQIDRALEDLGPDHLDDLRKHLGVLATQPFARDVFEELRRKGATPAKASADVLRAAVAKELAKAQQAASKTGLRSEVENVELAAVAKRFGKLSAALLDRIHALEFIPERVTVEGATPITRGLALRVREVYEALGLSATDDAVVDALQPEYPSFSQRTLDALHRDAKLGKLLPDRKELRRAQKDAELHREVEAVTEAVKVAKSGDVDAVIRHLRAVGYPRFDARRLAAITRRFPSVVLAESDKAAPFSHTDPSLRLFLLRAVEDLDPFATLESLRRRLAASRKLTETYGEPTQGRVYGYYQWLFGVGHSWFSARQRRNLVALVAERMHAGRSKRSIAEVVAELCAERRALIAEGGLRDEIKTWVHTPENAEREMREWVQADPETFADVAELDRATGRLVLQPVEGRPALGAKAKPGVHDRAYAEMVAWHFRADPGASDTQVGKAVQLFDPGFDGATLEQLRRRHKDLELVAREPAIDAAVVERVEKVLEKNIDLSPERVAVALRLPVAEVVPVVREVRERITNQLRRKVGDADRLAVARALEKLEPGGSLGDLEALVRADPEFARRGEALSRPTLRKLILAAAPETADWQQLQRMVLCGALVRTLEQNPTWSLSMAVEHLRGTYRRFPSYLTVRKTLLPFMREQTERMPAWGPFFDEEGHFVADYRLSFAPISKPLKELVIEVLKKAPGDWSNEQIFAAINLHPKFPVGEPPVDQARLDVLRRKFGDEIPRRRAERRTVDRMREDAEDLARALRARERRGEPFVLKEMAKAAGRDFQDYRRLVKKFPELFPMLKRRNTAITEHMARVIGDLIRTMPFGVKPSVAADIIRDSGLLPDDRLITEQTIKSAREKYPEWVPTLVEHNAELFERMLAFEIFTAPQGATLEEIYFAISQRCGFTRGNAAPIAFKTFVNDVLPRWEDLAVLGGESLPDWLKPLSRESTLQTSGMGRPAKDFPPLDLEAIQNNLAELGQIPDKLPVLEEIVKANPGAFAHFNVVNIQHLLGSNYRFVEAVHRIGVPKEDMITVAIPYSTNRAVLETMRGEGYEVYNPPLNIAAWERQVEDSLYAAVESYKRNGKEIVVFDDGGLVAQILHTKPYFAQYRKLFRIVEQTTRGITVASKYDLETPVVAVAREDFKLEIEGPWISESVIRAIKERLAGIDVTNLEGKTVTVTGYGSIGPVVAEMLAEMGAKVRVWDTDPAKRQLAQAEAKKKGYNWVIAESPEEAFLGANMVVGNTGHRSVDSVAFDLVADGCIFASSSSKLVEVDMGEIDRRATVEGKGLQREVVPDGRMPPTAVYTLADGRKLTVLADGFPINFTGAVNCVEPSRIQLIHGGMLLAGIQCTRELVSRQSRKASLRPGIQGMDPKHNQLLKTLWREVGPREDDEDDDRRRRARAGHARG